MGGTGIAGVDLGPCVWTLDRFTYWLDPPYHSRQRFFLVRVDADDVSNVNQFDYEREVYVETRWWSLAALEASTDTHYPEGVLDAVSHLMRGDIPAGPIALPDSGQE